VTTSLYDELQFWEKQVWPLTVHRELYQPETAVSGHPAKHSQP